MKLERAEVIRTAIRLLDEVGLDGLSLRRLARELNVQAPALYWHFKNKQELLDHIVAEMARGMADLDEPAPGQSWDDWLAERARALRARFLSHPDAVRLAAGTRPTADRRPTIERMVKVLQEAGFTPTEALYGILAITDYVSGAVLEEQSGRRRESPPEASPVTALAAESPPAETQARQPDRPPAGPALGTSATELPIPNSEEGFEFGLSLLIDGMRARLAQRSNR